MSGIDTIEFLVPIFSASELGLQDSVTDASAPMGSSLDQSYAEYKSGDRVMYETQEKVLVPAIIQCIDVSVSPPQFQIKRVGQSEDVVCFTVAERLRPMSTSNYYARMQREEEEIIQREAERRTNDGDGSDHDDNQQATRAAFDSSFKVSPSGDAATQPQRVQRDGTNRIVMSSYPRKGPCVARGSD